MADLRRKVAAAGAEVEFSAGEAGTGVVTLAGPQGSARIALQGAQVLEWSPPGHQPVLWCSPAVQPGSGKAMRGGVPLCWPWFGPHPIDPAKPQHGHARNSIFRLDEICADADGWRLRLSLPPGSILHGGTGDGLGLEVEMRVGAALGLEIETTNAGTGPALLSFAFHTYFHVSDVRQVRVDGLEGARFRDNADGGKVKSQAGPLLVGAETVALFDESGPDVRMVDPMLGRSIEIIRSGCPSTIVWNPGAAASAMADIPAGDERRFLCVESGAIGRAVVAVAPGERHRAGVKYRIATTGA